METGWSRGGGGGGGGGAVSARGCDRASAGVCGRKEGAGAGTLAADMDSHCDCAAEPPAAEPPPSGKINKAAFKLFKKRKSGGTMPSIFGVKNKGDAKSSAPTTTTTTTTTGMVRSRTHDGLAEVVVLEGGRKEEPRGPNPGPPRAAAPGPGSLAAGSVAKSHSFFSLLRKNGRPEPGKGDPADASRAGGKQKRGLRGIFSGMRWPRKDRRGGGEGPRPARAATPGALGPPGSLTASLECVKEEPARARGDAPPHPAGCGDIIADPEEEAGPSSDKQAPGPGKPAPPKKTPGGVVAYQGGGEEMASPDGVDDTCLQEFWDMLSQAEDQGQAPPEAAVAKAAPAQEAKAVPETSRDARAAEAPRDASSVKRRRLHGVPAELHPKEEPQPSEKEPPEGVPNSDQGYWDSTTPGPEEDAGAGGGKRSGLPRDSDSGDALYDLYAEPDASPAGPPAGEETACLSRLKPVSPGAITCPLRTPGSLLKDSKIPISIKHLSNLPSSHPATHQQPAKSELRRTKIPVSKVLVRRVSNRGLAGTTLRAAALHDSAKKL
ncbi:APC membrane recruitment protein 2 isoform X2 [Cavia porcellus]|uniref:APC membrane recruitment protein 2 isoform X2 n=1 Tax=Cavia porcellus TaxID=10141 RepID=UPI002FE0F58E